MKKKSNDLSEIENLVKIYSKVDSFLFLKNYDSSCFLGGCEKAINLFNFKNMEDARNYNDYTIKHPLADYGDFFIEQDSKLRKTKLAVNGFFCLYYQNEFHTWLTRRFFADYGVEKKLAIAAQAIEIIDAKLKNAIISIAKYDPVIKKTGKNKFTKNYFSQKNYSKFNLSVRQSQCLFYLLRGKSIPTIAQILSLSNRTVEDYFDVIKNKIGAQNKSEVIEKAIENGLLEIIPEGCKIPLI